MTDDKSDLLPCPFCGGPAELDNAAEPQFARRPTVTCAKEDCFGYMPSAYFSRDAEAIAAWNHRPTPAPAPVEPVAWRYLERSHWTYTNGPDQPHPGNDYPVEPLRGMGQRMQAKPGERPDLRDYTSPPTPTGIEEAARVAALERTIEFVTRWAWRDGPLTDAERLSAIKYHPAIKPQERT